MVREYKGSHSGEHGDGLVRSELHEPMFGTDGSSAPSREIKDIVRPDGPVQSGQDRATAEDGRPLAVPLQARLSRRLPIETALDWSDWGGFGPAPWRCATTTAHCRKSDAGVMCPSYRATARRAARHARPRQHAAARASPGSLARMRFTSEPMYETLDLCVGCKGCKRECPTGVDIARMKIEFLHHYRKRHGMPLAGAPDRVAAALRAERGAARRRC